MKSRAMSRDLKRKKSLLPMRSNCRNYSWSIGSYINRIIKGSASYLSFGMRYPASLKIGDKSLLFWGKTIEKIRLWVKEKGPTRLARVSEMKTWICMERLDIVPLSLLEDTGSQKKLSEPRCIQLVKLLRGISRSKRKKCERFMPI